MPKYSKNNYPTPISQRLRPREAISPSSIMAINNFSQIQPENMQTPDYEVNEAKDWVDHNEK